MSEMIRILVADDHPIVRDGLVMILSTQRDFAVVGEADDGQQVVALAAELLPDVILLDLEMPNLDGVAALTQMRAVRPDTRTASRIRWREFCLTCTHHTNAAGICSARRSLST